MGVEAVGFCYTHVTLISEKKQHDNNTISDLFALVNKWMFCLRIHLCFCMNIITGHFDRQVFNWSFFLIPFYQAKNSNYRLTETLSHKFMDHAYTHLSADVCTVLRNVCILTSCFTHTNAGVAAPTHICIQNTHSHVLPLAITHKYPSHINTHTHTSMCVPRTNTHPFFFLCFPVFFLFCVLTQT